MKKNILLHFQKVDPVLYNAALLVHPKELILSTDFFTDLCEMIVSQQLSEKAGTTIFLRFQKLFKENKITVEQALLLSQEEIRSVGVSNSKAVYILELAKAINSKLVVLDALSTLSNEEVILSLTKVKGIGPWTAEMFLMFSLAREDVFSTGDLGLKRAIQRLYKFENDPTLQQVLDISKKWSPYRTYACNILWKSLELK